MDKEDKEQLAQICTRLDAIEKKLKWAEWIQRTAGAIIGGCLLFFGRKFGIVGGE